MNDIWMMTADDYIEIVKRAKDLGLKEGESMEEVLKEYMKEKNQKPIAKTNKDLDVLCGDMREEGMKVLNMNELKNKRGKHD